jgi:hypothetical protein
MAGDVKRLSSVAKNNISASPQHTEFKRDFLRFRSAKNAPFSARFEPHFLQRLKAGFHRAISAASAFDPHTDVASGARVSQNRCGASLTR